MAKHNKQAAINRAKKKAQKENDRAEVANDETLAGLDEDTRHALEGVDTKSLKEAMKRGGHKVDLKDKNSARDEGKIGWEFPICFSGGQFLTGHKLRHLGAGYAIISCMFAIFSLYKGISSPLWSVTETTHLVADYAEPWDGRSYTRTYACRGVGPTTCDYPDLLPAPADRSHAAIGVQSNAMGICTEFDFWPNCAESTNRPELSYLVCPSPLMKLLTLM
jgi:hypothetical protein